MALLQVNFSSVELEHSTNISIIFPENIINKRVLFLFHGYSGSQLDWVRHTSIEKLASEFNVIVVMPEINNSYYTNMKYGANYFNYVAKELPNYISNLFNIKLNKENTYVGGLSMGGYGALKCALTYPKQYRAVFGLSSVTSVHEMYKHMNTEKRINMLEATFGKIEEIKNEDDIFHLLKNDINELDIYLTCGTDDFLYKDNLKLEKELINLNINHKYVFNEGNHNWDYWNYNIRIVFEYLFKVR